MNGKRNIYCNFGYLHKENNNNNNGSKYLYPRSQLRQKVKLIIFAG